MNDCLKNKIVDNMLSVAQGSLRQANRHAAYSLNEDWPVLAVLQAAHAAELFVKARIAEEHPLLIFSDLPPVPNPPEPLEFGKLLAKGRTYQWNDLPDRLWATTGLVIDKAAFQEFGRSRNSLQHFARPENVQLQTTALGFIYKVIDSFIFDCWGFCAIDYDEDDEPYVYITGSVLARGLTFKVSKDAAECFETWEVDWSTVAPETHKEMLTRVREHRPEAKPRKAQKLGKRST